MTMLDPAIRMLHDQWGNCDELLDPADRLVLEQNTWFRADGNTPCSKCGKAYWQHDYVLGALWLHRICTGDIVKL